MQSPTRLPSRLRQAYRIVLALAGICVGLLAVVVYLMLHRDEGLPLATALADPEVRQQVIAQLVAENKSIFDSHADADVGRVLLPELRDRQLDEIRVSTNVFGMRERAYDLPKPADVVRIVILGDSMVFGFGVAAEERLGAHLETWLKERVPGFDGRIECLHLGVPSWNIQAEAAYLRRQLSDLQPDLVVHIIVPNDIDDSAGTRGFGVAASFTSQHRQRADVRITAGFPRRVLGLKQVGFLRLGLDYESQSRYTAAARDIQHLAQAVGAVGGRYRLLVHYRQLLPVAWKRLTRQLDPEQVVYMSPAVVADRSLTIARNDPHWNREGHTLVARMIYGLITRDDLLPRLDPPAWEEATAALEEIAAGGRRLAERELDDDATLAIYKSPKIATSLDFTDIDAATAAQIHGGLDKNGGVSPYASFLLRNDGGSRLRISGRALPHRELDGSRVRVFVDAEQVGEFKLQAGGELDLSYRLPPAAAERSYLSVRFEADDYVYQGPDLQHCVVFRLERLAITAPSTKPKA